MDFESLIRVLADEHRVMEAGLDRMEKAAEEGDFAGVAATLAELEPIFRQHIADEESQILRLLIGELGVTGAEDEIKVFQQHRPIHKLMQLVAELAARSAAELANDQSRLRELFLAHASMEEQRVFPKALGVYGKQRGRQISKRT
jgi:hypothetical protein